MKAITYNILHLQITSKAATLQQRKVRTRLNQQF